MSNRIRTYQRAGMSPAELVIVLGLVGMIAAVLVVALPQVLRENDCEGDCTNERTTRSEANPSTECDPPTMPAETCALSCETSCKLVYERNDGVACHRCPEPVALPNVEPGTCPVGTSTDQEFCQSNCSNGLCVPKPENDLICYRCLSCPEGTHTSEEACAASCNDECTVTAQEDALQCWRCLPSCTDLCAQNGYNADIDYSEFILERLNDRECVAGATIHRQTARIANCLCTREPDVIMNDTVPVCKNTTCGDVACGDTTFCFPEPGKKTTVDCQWRGWHQLGPNDFQPTIEPTKQN